MSYYFPIDDVTVFNYELPSEPGCLADEYFVSGERFFFLDIPQVARFLVNGGRHIEIMSYPEADRDTIELYLNGSVYGVILHQRKIPPLHASCFDYHRLGIMVCGESGAGKSSLTAAFCLRGAAFLTDDVTPVVFEEDRPCVWSISSDRIKLCKDSIRQLGYSEAGLKRILPDWEKYHFPMKSAKGRVVPVQHVFVLEVYDQPEANIYPISDGVEKFTILRNEVYREEYSRAMPGGEGTYLEKLVRMSKRVSVTKILRPLHYPIEQLRELVARRIQVMKPVEENVVSRPVPTAV